MRDWRSLPVRRKGPPGPDAEHCAMLILRGDPEEIEDGSFPHMPELDEKEIERLVGRRVSGWSAVRLPPEALPRGPWKPSLSASLDEALKPLGASGWMREIQGREAGLPDERALWFSAYGPDADAMLECMCELLPGRPIRAGSFAVLYRGHGAKERVFLDAL